MDIYRFINSADIARHLRDIRYSFNALEAAWLIWQCKTATMAERHTAWRELIRTMPDCSVKPRFNREGSLHQMLRDYMSSEEKLQAIWEEDDINAMYTCYKYIPILDGNKNDWCPAYCCKNIRDVRKFITDAAQEGVRCFICKSWYGVFDVPILSVYYNTNGELMHYSVDRYLRQLSDSELDLYFEAFDDMYFDFPIPFKKGDLVQSVHLKEPFVLMDTTPWRVRRHLTSGDNRRVVSLEMYAFGYSYSEQDRFLWDDYMTCYMDLEYCTESLAGHKRILEAYSRYEKGQIDAWTLLKFFRMYDCEDIAAREHKQLKSFGAVD